MRFKGSRPFLIPVITSALLLSGCLIPNKDLVSLQNSVAKLSKENIEIRAGQEQINNNLKSELTGKIALIQKGQKRSGADYSAELDVIRADFQNLLGQVDEIKYLLNSVESERISLNDSLNKKINTIEEKVADLNIKISKIKLEPVSSMVKKEKPKKPKQTQNELYKSALGSIMDGKTKEARTLFREYLKKYSDQPLANNAQYWFAESFYDEKKFERAIVEYDEVIKKYPQGSKVPSALLKQGMAFKNINDNKSAVAIFKKLLKKYPDSDEAKKAARKIKDRKK